MSSTRGGSESTRAILSGTGMTAILPHLIVLLLLITNSYEIPRIGFSVTLSLLLFILYPLFPSMEEKGKGGKGF